MVEKYILLIFLFIVVISIIHLMGKLPDFDEGDFDLEFDKEIGNKHSGHFHKVISYNHTNTVEVFTYHYGNSGCKSGFMKDFDIEMNWEGSRIYLLGSDSHNITLKLVNPKRTHEKKLLIGKWEYRNCGCMVWNWRTV